MKKVVVVGGGFGGINAAKILAKNKNIEITLIDKHNYHLFQPLLYQVAMAGLSPAEIAKPIRSMFSRSKNIKVLQCEVYNVDKENKKVITKLGSVAYDYLILACGSKHGYFGHNEWEEYAPGLKSLEQATEIRRRVLQSYEMAEIESDAVKQKMLLTFVVVGGGPTGVELAGAIGEMSRFTLARDFKNIDPTHARVILLEAAPRILPSY
ncbi:MAG: FAD-dependent oxidoreductase, partial [Calditrichaceae bacterium]